MSKKIFPGLLGGFLGLVVGIIGGGFLGLVLGGNLLGSFDIYESTGMEGYEISAYIGAIIGAIVMAIVGVKLALNIFKKRNP